LADIELLGRKEIKAIFGCSERDSIRLLHKFGAKELQDALSLPRPALLVQLNAIRASSTYAAFLRHRQDVALRLSDARAESAARQFQVRLDLPERARPRFHNLPETVTLRRSEAGRPGHFEVQYADGADLMRQLAEFLYVAGVNREEFLAATEPFYGEPG
jgi:hypothetical protein